MKCLVFGNILDPQYHPLGPVAEEIKAFPPEIGFAVSEDPADLCHPGDAGFDAVLNYSDWLSRPFPDDAIEGLMRFVESGGGLVNVHNGIIINNTRFREWTGAVFTGHPEYQELSFKIEPVSHPVTAGLADFRQSDEMYRFDFAGETPRPLVSCEFEGKRYPCVWTKGYGRGRLITLAPGHTADTFRHPVFREILLRSLFWSAGHRVEG